MGIFGRLTKKASERFRWGYLGDLEMAGERAIEGREAGDRDTETRGGGKGGTWRFRQKGASQNPCRKAAGTKPRADHIQARVRRVGSGELNKIVYIHNYIIKSLVREV